MDLKQFLKEQNISAREAERELNLPQGTVSKGIPDKHKQRVAKYLRQFGYPAKYNEGINPEFHDTIPRFRDSGNGLWKRFKEWCIRGGETIKGFEPQDGEAKTDEIGEYYETVNGTQVYISYF